MTREQEPENAAFRAVPRTGVIFVTTEAQKRGFGREPGWCNLGQGQPEVGPLAGAPDRLTDVHIDEDDLEYAPVPGLDELREAVADHYNRLYRRGHGSRYSAENVCISAGGRAGLTRAAAALGHINLGHFLPDYTAYEELLEVFRLFNPIPILLERDRDYSFTEADLRREILGRGMSAILMSNPCNPTGKLVGGEDLAAWVHTARELDCTLLMDEFYSHYVWDETPGELPTESAARYVEDVDRDPVVLFDGLTKNWRYPGFRVAWTVGPKDVIDAISSAGSFLDGGANRPLQRAAIGLLAPNHVEAEVAAISRHFRAKREFMIERLQRLGVQLDLQPGGTFYVWGRLTDLPPGLNRAMDLFWAALDDKVITVPGQFFDVNPGKRRGGRHSRFEDYTRFSFGPPLAVLEGAMDRLEALVVRRRAG